MFLKKRKIPIIIFTITFILVLLVGYKYINYRKNIYPYNVQKDYEYVFNEMNTMKVDLINGQFSLPDNISGDYSVFLKIRIKSTFFGKYFPPNIVIQSKTKSYTEYFEDGVDGYRYLNLSNLVNGNSKKITLLPNKIIFKDQIVEVSYFKNNELSNSKILIIGTHPDDAEIAAFGLYSSYSNSFVLNIKSGESGEYNYDEVYKDTIEHYRKKGQLRTWNSITVPLLGGIDAENILNLGYFTDLKQMYFNKKKIFQSEYAKTIDINTYRNQNVSILKDSLVGSSNWVSLVKNLEILLSIINPDIIITPYPALDRHHEHKYTTIAVLEAIKNSNIKNGNLFLYSNHYVLNEYYPYGNAGGTASLPPNFNNAIYFESIFSFPLDEKMQNDKLFALEAMNDLRPDTEWRFANKAIKNALMNAKTEILGGDNSYFRRAIRSNELFFVIPIEKIYDETITHKIIYGNSKEGFSNNQYKQP